jgi:hypothetical protein
MSQISSTSMKCKTPDRSCRVPPNVDELLRAPRRQHPRRMLSVDGEDGLVRRLFPQDEAQNSDRNSGAVTPKNRNIRVDFDKVLRAPRREPNQRPIQSLGATPINLMKQFEHC